MSGRIVEIEVADPLYARELDLRYRVLRAPLGLGHGSVAFPGEERARHHVALDARGEVTGCVLLVPDGTGGGQLRQMAVEPSLRRSGLGRALVRALEARARADGIFWVTMHARDIAVGFYERLGYEVVGEPFEEVGIAHRHMVKRLE